VSPPPGYVRPGISRCLRIPELAKSVNDLTGPLPFLAAGKQTAKVAARGTIPRSHASIRLKVEGDGALADRVRQQDAQVSSIYLKDHYFGVGASAFG
jgi:hypothetical protein